jgi:hypothetical protein
MKRTWVVLSLTFLFTSPLAFAERVTIPSGTRVFGELEQEVTSDVKAFKEGDLISGRVWRNVVVDGQTVLAAGSPMVLQVSGIKKRKAFGRAGSVEVRAVSVTAVDGTEIFLDGGYDKQGANRVALSATLFALVAWPTAFIKGKEAVLPPGTVFDASIPANTVVNVTDVSRPTIKLTSVSALSVEILYDDMTEGAKDLPLQARLCTAGSSTEPLQVTAVNDGPIDPLEIEVLGASEEDGCRVVEGSVGLKELAKHFSKGINRFTVSAGEETTEVILDVEM